MLAFSEAGISEQFFSAWEEFNTATPDDDVAGPWGMITQQGRRKPEFYVYKLFDQLSRGSQGIAAFRSPDDTTRALISRDSDGKYSVMMWETGYPPGVADAVKVLQENGVRLETLDRYGTMRNFESALKNRKPLESRDRAAFDKARTVYEQNAAPNLIRLAIPASQIKILEAKHVASELESAAQVYIDQETLVADIPRMEVLWLRLEIKR